MPGTMTHVQRLREIRVQAMVEGTAQARVKRALEPKRDRLVRVSVFNFGDLADVHRTPVVTDASGWKGPAEIIDNTNLTQGTLAVRYQRDLPI